MEAVSTSSCILLRRADLRGEVAAVAFEGNRGDEPTTGLGLGTRALASPGAQGGDTRSRSSLSIKALTACRAKNGGSPGEKNAFEKPLPPIVEIERIPAMDPGAFVGSPESKAKILMALFGVKKKMGKNCYIFNWRTQLSSIKLDHLARGGHARLPLNTPWSRTVRAPPGLPSATLMTGAMDGNYSVRLSPSLAIFPGR
ncbi:hypothetical protein KM043_002134 [Ampulex compressa]|nr:hypothetical protein KM043_002134 [Ampulex compressa]